MHVPTMQPRLPIVKVCGVTCLEDLEMLADEGVDSVGFNFVATSPRFVDVARAEKLCARARELGLLRIAVVMDLAALDLSMLLERIEVDFVQLHGLELPEIRNACKGLGIIKAVSWSGREQERSLAQAWQASTILDTAVSPAGGEQVATFRAFLVDAFAPGQGGGTGKVARWDLLVPRPDSLAAVPLILAGGLTPANVAEAIHQTRPDGVDTASGVELSPGRKCRSLTSEFVRNAKSALGEFRLSKAQR